MGTRFQSFLLVFLLSCLILISTASCERKGDGTIRIGLKKRKLDRSNRLASQLFLKNRGGSWFPKYFSTGKPASIRYGTGAIAGYFSYDDVKVGDLVVKEQEFIVGKV